MTRPHSFASTFFVAVATLALVGCNRSAAPGADSTQATGSTVQATPPGAASSTPLPVSPAGLTNSSTASKGSDLSNSTSATGSSNTYQPPSSDNPAPAATAAASAGNSASAARASVSSQTRGTSPPPNDGTLPRGTEGSTGSRGGAGKS
ncbi:MAG TPA: hypothetical protein VGO85_00835 [Caldimonas sp.]|nr:hypothetical protein [Caldimonas sp.]